MKKRTQYRLMSVAVAITISLVIIILHIVSHRETQEIYTNQMEHLALNIKKDFLHDTVNNVIGEIEHLRESKRNIYQINTNHRLNRFQEALRLTDVAFVDFYVSEFEEEKAEDLWSGLLYNKATQELLYTTEENKGDLAELIHEFNTNLSAQATIEKGDLVGVFGVHNHYIDTVIKTEIKTMLHQQTYANDAYIWVNEVVDYNGGDDYAVRRIHPNLKDTEGMYLSTDAEDLVGNKPYQEELNGINQEGELFFTYFFKEMKRDSISEKVTYAKLYEPYDWIIAMGVHLNDIEHYVNVVNEESDARLSGVIARLLIYLTVAALFGFFLLYIVSELNLTRTTSRLEREANFDPLTDAYSRRYGERLLEESFSRYQLLNESFVIVMIDIDNFKEINDHYGHEAGDDVLRALSKQLKASVNKSEFVIRWGGDEFILILKETDEQLMPRLNDLKEQLSNRAVTTNNDEIFTSVSIGATHFAPSDIDPLKSVARADKMMYQSKHDGEVYINYER